MQQNAGKTIYPLDPHTKDHLLMIVSCRRNVSKKSINTLKIGSDTENREVKKRSKKRGRSIFFLVSSSYP